MNIHTILLRIFVALWLALGLSTAAYAQSSSTDTEPKSTIKVETELADDFAIQQRIRDLFAEIGELKGVFVTVQSGVVSLRGRVLETADLERAASLASRVDGVASVKNSIEVETSVEKRITPALERFTARTKQFVSAAPLIALGVIVFLLIALVGFLLARMKYPWDAVTPNRFIANLLRQFVRLAFILLGLVIALDILGATALLGTIVGAAGILGLAIGFAVRDTVENYIASILLSFRQPFRPGDYVDIDGQEGSVMALTSRATVLITADGNHVRIPNATVFKGIITNYSLNPERRIHFKIGVETEDLQRAIDLGLEEISGLSFVLADPAPAGWIAEIGDSSIILWFGAWIDQTKSNSLKARSEVIRHVKLVFEQEGIGLPEPIYRLRFDDDLPVTSTKGKPSKTIKKPASKMDQEAELDTSPDFVIEKKIAQHDGSEGGTNLLDGTAKKEF